MGKADQIIEDALRKTANRSTGTGGDYGSTPQPMTGEEALRTARAAFDAYINEIGVPIEKDFAKIKELTEILAGTRNRVALSKAAVRYEDLRELKQFPSRPPGFTYASGTVTADQYNALYADVKKLYELMGAIAVVIGARI